MYASLVAAVALAASVSQVTASPVNHLNHMHVARGYRQDAEILEDYTPYHTRYIALNCQGQHNTQFFEDCCHPLLRWQKLSDRPAKCIPSASASSSAALAEPTSPTVDEDPIPDYDDDCEDPTSSTPAAVAATPSPEPTSTKTPASTSYKPETTPAPETTPEPSTTKKPSSTSAEPTSTSAPSGGNDDFTGGFATFFTQNGNAGACGDKHDDSFKLVALDYRRYGPLSKQSDDCGRSVTITNTKNGKSVTAIVADACPTCTNENCLDLSLGAFDAIATREEGMVPISWHFN